MKRVVIMGASSGIGEALARRLASAGCRVGVCARSTAKLLALQKEFPSLIEYQTVDVTAHDAPQLVGGLISRLGGMDVYVHVSGIGYSNPELQPERELATLDVNVVGFARMIGYAFRHFRDRRGGHGKILAVTSVAGTKGIGTMASYSASKCFDQRYLQALRQLCRMQKLDITVTDIRPGWVATPLLTQGKRYPMLMTTDTVADGIARLLRRRRRVAVIDRRWNLLVGLWRLLPNWLWERLTIDPGELGSKS